MSQNTVLLQGRYRVKSILGTGGFSTIYLAVDETTGAEVSIKEFTAEHMDGLATALRVNAYDIANRSEPQPVPDPSDLSGEEKLSRGLMQVRRDCSAASPEFRAALALFRKTTPSISSRNTSKV